MRTILRRDVAADAEAWAALWIIADPSSHPLWNQYVAHVVKLRPVPGFPDAVIHLEGATHEVMIWPLDPRYPATEKTEAPALHLLKPANHGYQFKSESDAAAVERVHLALLEAPSVDTDFRAWWDARFRDGQSLLKSALAAAAEAKK